MSLRRLLALSALLGVALLLTLPLIAQPPAGGDELNDEHEKVMKAAVRKVARSVVQILTQGGADMVAVGPKGVVFRKGQGPTTGVIVSEDGYIVSSAFNFLNNPTNILVAVPEYKEPFVAERVATDRSRMLTLLKIKAKGLPVPQAVPEKEIQVGQWAIALGRTLDLKRDAPPSVCVGIVSALNRVWGKTIQTDAKVSPVNYGGPLVDVQGRVQGILIPASPRGEEETAGFEWYDSGIGFAVPMEHVLKVLPKLKEGKELKKGLLGIRPKGTDIYSAAAEIGQVMANSAAAKAGLKVGDVIVEIDGHPVQRHANVLHLLGPRYEGDKVSLKYRRGDKVVALTDLTLGGELVVVAHSFLGILPMRDDPKLGVEVRYVYPKSPADTAGLKPGDRIVKVGLDDKAPAAFKGQKRGRDELFDLLNGASVGAEIKLEVIRKGSDKPVTLTTKLDTMPGSVAGKPEVIPAKLPEVASAKKALEPLEQPDPKVKPAKVDPPKKPETGLLKKTTSGGQKYWVYLHEDYDPNIAHGVVLWLHPPGKHTDDDVDQIVDGWAGFCADHNLILIGPRTEGDNGWVPSDSDWVLEALRDTLGRYTVDRQRVVAHGMGVGGQMAVYLGFAARDLIRGVGTMGAVVTEARDNLPNQRLSFFLAAGDRDPLAKAVAESRTKLINHRLPVTFREIANRGREYLDDATLRELVRWIDALDRQ